MMKMWKSLEEEEKRVNKNYKLHNLHRKDNLNKKKPLNFESW